MRTPLLTGAAAAAALMLVTVAPAVAAPIAEAEAETVTTVTSLSVPADLAVQIPYDFDQWGDASSITATGAASETVAYPLAAQTYDGDFIHHTFATSAAPAAGCVRTVNSFTFAYTLQDYDYQSIRVDSTPVIGAIGTGDPYEVLSFPPGNVTHDDTGFTVIGPDQVDIHLETMRANPAPQSGTLTIAYPEAVSPIEPVLAADARGYIGFTEPYEVTWVVDHASFLVTDTCTSDVEVPPVTPPVVEPPVTPPVVEPPAVTPPTTQPPATVTPVTPVTPVGAVTPPTLAKTGAADGWAGSGAAAALLLGAGATALVLARRRFTRAAN